MRSRWQQRVAVAEVFALLYRKQTITRVSNQEAAHQTAGPKNTNHHTQRKDTVTLGGDVTQSETMSYLGRLITLYVVHGNASAIYVYVHEWFW